MPDSPKKFKRFRVRQKVRAAHDDETRLSYGKTGRITRAYPPGTFSDCEEWTYGVTYAIFRNRYGGSVTTSGRLPHHEIERISHKETLPPADGRSS